MADEETDIDDMEVIQVVATLMTPDRVVASLNQLADTMTVDQFGEANNCIAVLDEFLKQAKAFLKAKGIELVNLQPDKQFRLGEDLYYAKIEQSVKCNDTIKTWNAIADAAGGEVEKIGSCMSVNAFKVAATRKLLSPEKFAECFTTKDKIKLGCDRLKKELIKLNTRFLK